MTDSISRHRKSLQELVGDKVDILIKPPNRGNRSVKRYPVSYTRYLNTAVGRLLPTGDIDLQIFYLPQQ